MARKTTTITGEKAQTMSQKRKIIVQLKTRFNLNVNKIRAIIFHQPSPSNPHEVTLSKASNGLYHYENFTCSEAIILIQMLANSEYSYDEKTNTISCAGDLSKPYITIIKN